MRSRAETWCDSSFSSESSPNCLPERASPREPKLLRKAEQFTTRGDAHPPWIGSSSHLSSAHPIVFGSLVWRSLYRLPPRFRGSQNRASEGCRSAVGRSLPALPCVADLLMLRLQFSGIYLPCGSGLVWACQAAAKDTAGVHCVPARWSGSQYRELISARALLSAGFAGGLIVWLLRAALPSARR
jgi:hypothetical protein